MDKDLKAKWCKALRSGKYKQGRGALNENRRFCCLGVLVDITHPDMWIEECIGKFSIPYNPRYGYEVDGVCDEANVFDGSLDRGFPQDLSPGELAGEWLDHYGLRGVVAEQLMTMNDGSCKISRRSHSFDEIADWIEENVQ